MNHIELNAHGEAVKQFFLSLPVDSDGSVVELNGRAVARVLPAGENGNGAESDGGRWTDAKDVRRCELVDKEIDGHLTPEEAGELETLQREMYRHLRAVAPLPLEDAQCLLRELVAKAEAVHKQ